MIQEIKQNAKKWCAIIPLFYLLVSCAGKQTVPAGCWRGDGQKPDIVIGKAAGGDYAAVVFHRLYDGNTCPVAYPFVLSATGMYIRAEGRILVSYDKEKDVLYLSPGGTYRRIYVDENIICSDYHCNFVFY